MPALVLLLLTIAGGVWMHRGVFSAPLFADDFLFLDQARHHTLLEALTSRDPLSNYYRPLGRQLYFWSLAKVFHESATAFHVMNLALFVFILGAVFTLARRFAGPRAAVLASGFLAVHYAFDVPLLWASGSQDLLAIAGALACLTLYVAGRTAWAAMALLVALLCKEVVLLVPLLLILVDREVGRDWREIARRFWPVALAWIGWAALWLHAARGFHHDPALAVAPWVALAATLAHLLQVIPGLEAGTPGALRIQDFLPGLLVVAAAVVLAWRMPRAKAKRGSSAPALHMGALWVAIGALPTALVVNLWSGYYYCFALCGFALAFGAWLGSRRVWIGLAALAFVALTSEHSRRLESLRLEPNAWSPSSHVNDYYIARSNRFVARYLESMKRALPRPRPGSTLVFANLPPAIAWQVADGPLVRWAYRDPSLHSYFLTRAPYPPAAGATTVFVADGDSLRDVTRDPELLCQLAYGQVVDEDFPHARYALELAARSGPLPSSQRYMKAWVDLALGDARQAQAELSGLGFGLGRDAGDLLRTAQAEADSGRSPQAVALLQAGLTQNVLDARLHLALGRLLLSSSGTSRAGVMSALAARVLSPQDPAPWREWAHAQYLLAAYEAALESLVRYQELLAVRHGDDPDVDRMIVELRRDLARRR